MKQLRTVEYREFSKSNIRKVTSVLAPKNSVFLGLNMLSDFKIGSLFSRLGTSIIGVKMAGGAKTILGIHHHFETAGKVLFAAISDTTNNDIYTVADGAKSLQDDTKDLKTRFLTYLGSTVRVNGTDAAKSYTIGGGWITTGGAFDVANMPIFSTVIEWKDRVFGAGSGSGIVKYSSIADSSTKTISWTATGTTGAGQIEIEQEDNGGDIKAFSKVPGYLLIFKQRTIKRWDGSSTYPEDLIKQGVYSQECICIGKDMTFFINTKGIWATNGGYPVRISKPVQDFIDNIPGANWGNVAMYSDDEHVYASIGNITIGTDSFTNIVLKYNIGQETFDIFSYYQDFRSFALYIDSNNLPQIVGGDTNGQVLQINTGYTDYDTTVKPITWSVETQDLEFGVRGFLKSLSRIFIYTYGVSIGQVLHRKDSYDSKDWRPLGKINKPIEEVKDFKEEGHWHNFKFTGTASSGQVEFLGCDFPESSITINDNVN